MCLYQSFLNAKVSREGVCLQTWGLRIEGPFVTVDSFREPLKLVAPHAAVTGVLVGSDGV